jgi:hypothetical protein
MRYRRSNASAAAEGRYGYSENPARPHAVIVGDRANSPAGAVPTVDLRRSPDALNVAMARPTGRPWIAAQ